MWKEYEPGLTKGPPKQKPAHFSAGFSEVFAIDVAMIKSQQKNHKVAPGTNDSLSNLLYFYIHVITGRT